MKMSIGVGLHKTQFTVCLLSEDRRIKVSGMFPTNEIGYRDFLLKIKNLKEEGFAIQTAVESTENSRFFKNKLNQVGVPVTVVNTVKYKVVNESEKKTDKYDALTLMEFLEKYMLPESRLCSQESEDLRRVLKSRSIMVKHWFF